jgi:hypothetical protein
MFPKFTRTTFIALLVVLALAIMLPVVSAQESTPEAEMSSDDDGAFKLTGILEEMDETTVTVFGLVFSIEDAEMDTDTPFVIGDVVEVEFIVVDGELVALKVEPKHDDDDSDSDSDSDDDMDEDHDADFKLAGVVEAMEGGTITILGLTFSIEDVEIDDDGSFEIGDVVKVEFSIVDDELVAVEVSIDDDDDMDDDDVDDDDVDDDDMDDHDDDDMDDSDDDDNDDNDDDDAYDDSDDDNDDDHDSDDSNDSDDDDDDDHDSDDDDDDDDDD